VRFRDDTRRFVSKDCAVTFSCPFKLDRPTEASFPIIQPGEPMLVERLFLHWLFQGTKDGHEIAQRDGFVLEHPTLGPDRFAGRGIGGTGF